MFLDIRGSRTFHRVPNDPYKYLGTDQWTELKSALGRGGIFDGVRALLVCSPAPVVFLTGLITDEFADHIGRLEDFKGHWSHRDHRAEQVRTRGRKWAFNPYEIVRLGLGIGIENRGKEAGP